MNSNTNYPYPPQQYGQLVETDENIAQGQPVLGNQIQMTSMIANQQSGLQMSHYGQQQQQQQQPTPMYQYPQIPQQQPNVYASNHIAQPNMNNTNYPVLSQPIYPQQPQQYPQAQIGIPPQMGQVNRIPTSRHSQVLYCENCKQNVESRVGLKNGSGAYIAGGVIAACGFWLGCCLIPCMVDDCKDSEHFCSRCGVHLGSKRFLFD